MKITVLSENTAARADVQAEHGLSLYIEACGKRILFDMGQGELFAQNARLMNIDLSQVDIAVISHGHYDHGGGLEAFLQINKNASVYINRRAFEPHYNAAGKYIGLDTRLFDSERLIFADDKQIICEGLGLMSCNDDPRLHADFSCGLTREQDGQRLPDDFAHEHYLLINEKGRHVLISGCSHKGILNIMRWLRPDVLVGGFHMKDLDPAADDVTIDAAAHILLRHDTRYFTCHCTGAAQYERMKRIMGERLSYISCGDTLEI